MVRDILFRPSDDDQDSWLRETANENKRPISEEMRAAVSVYLEIRELAKLRAVAANLGHAERELATRAIQRRLDNIGRVLLAAIEDDARNQFEADAQIEYPPNWGRVDIPFESLLPWITTGRADAG